MRSLWLVVPAILTFAAPLNAQSSGAALKPNGRVVGIYEDVANSPSDSTPVTLTLQRAAQFLPRVTTLAKRVDYISPALRSLRGATGAQSRTLHSRGRIIQRKGPETTSTNSGPQPLLAPNSVGPQRRQSNTAASTGAAGRSFSDP